MTNNFQFHFEFFTSLEWWIIVILVMVIFGRKYRSFWYSIMVIFDNNGHLGDHSLTVTYYRRHWRLYLLNIHLNLQVTHYIDSHNINCNAKHKEVMAILVSKSLPSSRYSTKISPAFSVIAHFWSKTGFYVWVKYIFNIIN